jgi:8-oxo-dGTP pyrophosphatase MutT (NUDIX family)
MPSSLRVRLVHVIAPSFTVGAICLIEHEGRLLLLRQRHRLGWTLPGGLLNRRESAERAVCREVQEETGLLIEVGLPLGVVVEPRSRRVDVVFHVQVDDEPATTAGSEAFRATWLHPDRAGNVDEPTAQAFALLNRTRQPGARAGRVLSASPRDPRQ